MTLLCIFVYLLLILLPYYYFYCVTDFMQFHTIFLNNICVCVFSIYIYIYIYIHVCDFLLRDVCMWFSFTSIIYIMWMYVYDFQPLSFSPYYLCHYTLTIHAVETRYIELQRRTTGGILMPFQFWSLFFIFWSWFNCFLGKNMHLFFCFNRKSPLHLNVQKSNEAIRSPKKSWISSYPLIFFFQNSSISNHFGTKISSYSR